MGICVARVMALAKEATNNAAAEAAVPTRFAFL